MYYVIKHTSENTDLVYEVCSKYSLTFTKECYFEVDEQDYWEFTLIDRNCNHFRTATQHRIAMAEEDLKNILVSGL